MPDRAGAAVAAVCAVVLAAVVVWLGAANPPRQAPIGTDRLGPETGEPVGDYLSRARASLAEPTESGAPRWALVAFDRELTATGAGDLLGDRAQVTQLWFRVPIARVQTPIVAVAVGGDESIARAPGYAAVRLAGGAGAGDRQSRVAAVSAARLGADCACVVAATVRAPTSDLAAVADLPGVRGVEALPADAVFGRFAVTPLLPEQTVVATPGPDDGPVPDR